MNHYIDDQNNRDLELAINRSIYDKWYINIDTKNHMKIDKHNE